MALGYVNIYTDGNGKTWSGRGKQPLWLAAQVKKGKKVEEFLIKK